MFLGIDVGSVYLSLALLDDNGALTHHFYGRHHGNVLEVLRTQLPEIPLAVIVGCAKTGSGARALEGLGPFIDPVTAQLDGTRWAVPEVRNVIAIGAGSFVLIRTTSTGEYLSHTCNSVCASGTGAFLDQQALRLALRPEELSQIAAQARRCPSVATRCAVFAKSDIIHLQQEGFGPDEIAAGLCHGLGRSVIDQLLQGRKLSGPTAVIGGVALNRQVVQAIAQRLGLQPVVPPQPQLIAAVGAALYARQQHPRQPLRPDLLGWNSPWSAVRTNLRPPLQLRYSTYPEFRYHSYQRNEHGTEVAVVKPLQRGRVYQVALGFDIGSTSTKAVLLSPSQEVLALYYRATAGQPLQAVQYLCAAMLRTQEEYAIQWRIMGVGTTGSGRKFIQKVIQADLARNEITAHAKAAVFIDPQVDTIIELGGQDAKFTQLQDGMVYNAVMNYVCAAGTGSFIEEQAHKLGLAIEDYADFVMGVRAPLTSDRCTVYMERDLERLLSAGCSKKEIAAAVLFSVRDNYLNKVVGSHRIGQHVYFQGATARNKALVAAFEQELEQAIAVSPYCHVTGALGMALLVLEQVAEPTRFRGLSFANAQIAIGQDQCRLCRNECHLTVVQVDDQQVRWGYKCGREEEATKPAQPVATYELFGRLVHWQQSMGAVQAPSSRGTIGVPYALTFHSYLPFWRAFFGHLGYTLQISGPSSPAILRQGEQLKTAEFCAPVVMSLGHVRELLQAKVDYYCVPYMIAQQPRYGFSQAFFCPHVQSHPALVRALFPEIPTERFLQPILKLASSRRLTVKLLLRELGPKLGLGFSQVQAALRAGEQVQRQFEQRCRLAGRQQLTALEQKQQIGIVLLGRPYNTADPVLALDLPRRIAQQGVVVLPLESLDLPLEQTAQEWPNMYWAYGQKILAAAHFVARQPRLFAVLLTSFSCGPDSYLIAYLQQIMRTRRKPYLILQLDAHGADAGYLTRIEAALETFKAWQAPTSVAVTAPRRKHALSRQHHIFIPSMDPLTVQFFAAGFRRFGYQCEALEEDQHALALGLRHCTGSECMPCPLTLGSFLKTVQQRQLQPQETALFMPSACGPCRFGQYHVLQSLVLAKLQMQDVLMLSPSSDNAYQGLPAALRRQLWDAVLVADLMHKVAHKIRPYERAPGAMDNVMAYYREEIVKRLALPPKRADLPGVFRSFIKDAGAIRTYAMGSKPLVGIVGEIYIRRSVFANQNLVAQIEALGGEALLATISEWILYTDALQKYLLQGTWQVRRRVLAYLKNHFFQSRERLYNAIAMELLHDRRDPPVTKVMERGAAYVPYEFQGESLLTIGRALLMIEEEGVQAVVNASPAFCMHGTFTAAIFPSIEERYGVPIISTFYDGSGNPNAALVPHLHYLTRRNSPVMSLAGNSDHSCQERP